MVVFLRLAIALSVATCVPRTLFDPLKGDRTLPQA